MPRIDHDAEAARIRKELRRRVVCPGTTFFGNHVEDLGSGIVLTTCSEIRFGPIKADMDAIERRWFDNLKQTMALDISRSMTQGLPPKAIVERLLEIPEVRQALEMRAKGRARD
jgi:hypothetical protein